MKSKLILLFVIASQLMISCVNSPSSNTADSTTKEKKSINQAPKKANTSAQIMLKKQIPVLCYHRISDVGKGDYTVSLSTFKSHIKALADSGYHSILPDQLYNYLVYNDTLPKKPFLITFDDSRAEHALVAVPELVKYGFRGTFFIMTITYNKKNYMSTDQIVALAESGHCVGLHSWDHTMATKYTDSLSWQKQVVEPKQKLVSITGKSVDYWAYPNGVTNQLASEMMKKYFKLSFILSTKRDTLAPLQTVRRIIIPDCSAESMLRSMHRSFK